MDEKQVKELEQLFSQYGKLKSLMRKRERLDMDIEKIAAVFKDKLNLSREVLHPDLAKPPAPPAAQ